jgi:hypothetical protein
MCGQTVEGYEGGFIQIYRMGSPIGIAAGYGTYINENPYGYIANKESVRIPLPFGTYTFHFTCGMTRKCEDLTVTLSPENPEAFMKVHIVAGFWTNKIVVEAADRSEMPEMD